MSPDFSLSTQDSALVTIYVETHVQHIHAIGEKTEKRIWSEGVTNWETFSDEHQS